MTLPLPLPAALLQVKTLVPPISQSGKVAGEVTQIAASPTANQIAVGYADGTVGGHGGGLTSREEAYCSCAAACLVGRSGRPAHSALRGGGGEAVRSTPRGAWGGSPRHTQPCRRPLPLQIRLWDLDAGECTATFSGHRKEVSALRFSRTGALLASGAQKRGVGTCQAPPHRPASLTMLTCLHASCNVG